MDDFNTRTPLQSAIKNGDFNKLIAPDFNPRTPLQSAIHSDMQTGMYAVAFQSTHSITECDNKKISTLMCRVINFNPRTPLQSAMC